MPHTNALGTPLPCAALTRQQRKRADFLWTDTLDDYARQIERDTRHEQMGIVDTSKRPRVAFPDYVSG